MNKCAEVKMIIFRLITLVISLIFTTCATAASASAESAKKRLLIIHSYEMDYEWTVEEDNGIQKAFNELIDKNNWFIDRAFLNGKKYQENPNLIEIVINNIKEDVLKNKPAAVILTDDLAFSEFYKFLQNLKIPISFGGVNGFLEDYGYKIGEKGITGTLEHNNFSAMVKIMKKIKPSIKNIIFVGDISQTTDAIIKNIKNQMALGKFKTTNINNYIFYKTGSFEELKKYLSNIDTYNTAVIYISFYTYKDLNNNNVYYRKVDEWVSQNTAIVDAGIASFHVKNGRLLSLASSANEIGYFCASQLFHALNSQRDPSEYPIRKYLPLKLVINNDRAKQLNIEIPFDILSYANDVKKLFERLN